VKTIGAIVVFLQVCFPVGTDIFTDLNLARRTAPAILQAAANVHACSAAMLLRAEE